MPSERDDESNEKPSLGIFLDNLLSVVLVGGWLVVPAVVAYLEGPAWLLAYVIILPLLWPYLSKKRL